MVQQLFSVLTVLPLNMVNLESRGCAGSRKTNLVSPFFLSTCSANLIKAGDEAGMKVTNSILCGIYT